MMMSRTKLQQPSTKMSYKSRPLIVNMHLPMQKYDSIASFKKVFSRCGTSGSCTEVVNEAYCVFL